MTLSLNVSKTVGPGNPAGSYLKTDNYSGVFIDVAPGTFGSSPEAHCGVAFFCDGVPTNAPDNVPWTGQARGITFYADHRICWEDWTGNGNENHDHIPGAYWEEGVIYLVTATYTATDVGLGVYKTDSTGIVALVASAIRTRPSSGKGTHACVFSSDGGTIGCCPKALYG
ncbi:hypothetical protein KW843_22885 [Acidovorax sp. sif1233]|uniref:hypothetical protein n=1 Tax=Acidovorax sp. sif1233 TaxID=2854792 RepID=UPI001C45A4CE|nr:hypothetical protein [Acidovorax sp. sif1233]MBV7457344.1 hypothetical protein [Acidovorax sp. sif1233]